MMKTPKELYDEIRSSPDYIRVAFDMTQNRAKMSELKVKNDKLEEDQLNLEKPLLVVCVATHGKLANCPEVVGRSGWCDDCPNDEICPSIHRTWTD
jgi:hypothetical protein